MMDWATDGIETTDAIIDASTTGYEQNRGISPPGFVVGSV
jgi:hypothetical protein